MAVAGILPFILKAGSPSGVCEWGSVGFQAFCRNQDIQAFVNIILNESPNKTHEGYNQT